MTRRRLVLPAGAVLWLMPQAARAHGVLEGVGDFYAGLLHPFVVPAELLAIVATGLLLGWSGVLVCQRGILAFAGAVAAGLVLAQPLAMTAGATPALIAAALVAAAVVTAGLRAPAWFATTVAAVAGLAVGIDAAPEAEAVFKTLLSGAATVLGGAVLITIVAALVLGAEQHWHRIAARVAGSWITASAILYLTWHMLVLAR